jgi:hypothetical protein
LAIRKGQINNDQCVFGGSCDHFGVVNDLIQSDRKRRRLAVDNIAETIPHEQNIDPRRIKQPCSGIIIDRECNDLAILFFERSDFQRKQR